MTRLHRIAPGYYRTADNRFSLIRDDNGTWYLYDDATPGADSLDFGPTLRDLRSRLNRFMP